MGKDSRFPSNAALEMVSDSQRVLLWIIFRDTTEAEAVLNRMPVRALERLQKAAVDLEAMTAHTITKRREGS
jgi:cellulose biosynthesis protein BcsQ